MKNPVKILGIATVIFLSACGTSNVTVMKRKYNPGYYVDFSGNTKTDVTVTTSTVKTKKNDSNSQSSELATETKTQDNVIDQNGKDYPLIASTDNKIHIAPIHKGQEIKSITSTISKNENETSKLKKKIITSIIKNKIDKKTAAANIDGKTILLIILSLFPILALIAVFIKDDNRITLNFWVDLLLHFIFLYWLFAILVVLDVINLA